VVVAGDLAGDVAEAVPGEPGSALGQHDEDAGLTALDIGGQLG
jgi:hypothetical protein